ncbi:MAG: signal peptide peptidase SppA [Bacteroidota bacterium]
MAFLRNFLAAFLALVVFFFFLFVLSIGFFSLLAQEEKPVVEENSVLHLKLNGIIRDRSVEDPFSELFGANGPRVTSLMDLLRVIKEAKEDDNIVGIYMEHLFISAGYSSLQELRDALLDFKSSGKFVYSYAEYMSEGDYYLASVADEIYLHPEGSMEFNGLSANVSFYKGLFEKLEIEPEIFRVGEFKSAVEPLIRKDLSAENELQLNALLDDLNATYLSGTSESRGIDLDRLRTIQDKMEATLPNDFEQLNLVTKVAYKDEIKSLILEKVEEDEIDDVNFISARSYRLSLPTQEYSPNRIAVIMAEGNIVMAGQPDQDIIGDQIAKEIRKARESSTTKAIVLRINSPGGSITASDIIWREVALTKGVKPIIASFSDYAASGGYYIGMACDTIVAQRNTITGSIGIFSILFNFEQFLEKKLGITHDVVKTGEYSDYINLTRPFRDEERAILQKSLQKGYDSFTGKAAEARNMSKEQLIKLAGGRVWSGNEAFNNDLVDVLGSFDDAITLAAEAAGVDDDFRVTYYPRSKPFVEQLLENLSGEAVKVLYPELDLPHLKELRKLAAMEGIQARMLGEIEIN